MDGLGSQTKDTSVHSLDNRNSIKVFEMKDNMISAAHKKTNLLACISLTDIQRLELERIFAVF